MKTKLYVLIAVFFMSLGVNAQIDRSQQPKAGPAPIDFVGEARRI